jgi:hypothetical protein
MTCAVTPTPELVPPVTQALLFGDIDAVREFLIAEGARLCAAAFGNKARAIVLTGSMSRGEATLKRDREGWCVQGDATYLAVLKRSTPFHTPQLERVIESALLAHGIRCRVVVVTATSSSLRKMKPHIYAYELRERGIVVWGDPSVLHLMPRYAVAEIPKEDGWWLLCNRMIEQLEAAAQLESDQTQCAAVRYRIAKLYLAMAGCYLLSIDEYRPSYRERAEHLQELARSQTPPESPVPLQRFARLVSECTYLKLNGNASGDEEEFPGWRDAVWDAEAMWRWTLARMSGSDPCLDRPTLLAKAAGLQRRLARAKGWVRSACVQRAVFRRSWLRWARLVRFGSPRYLIYGAASDLFFASREGKVLTSQKLEELVSKLPLRPAQDARQLTWNTAAMMVAHNFHCLVESTRT